MALIKCPNCQHDISDKSKKCINCGYIINDNSTICEECGSIIKENESLCSKCGCPKKNNIQKVEISKVAFASKKKIIIACSIILAIIIITIASIIIVKKNNAEKSKTAKFEYENNIRLATKTMLKGASDAESCGGMIRSIWYNTIYKKDDYKTNLYTKDGFSFNDDFNDSLYNYFKSDNYKKYESNITANKTEVQNLMKKLKNPPEEWKDAYQDLKTYYDNYLTLTNMCLDPQGNLQTYTSNFNKADTDTYNNYQKMQSYFE